MSAGKPSVETLTEAPGNCGLLPPTNLRCEYRRNPLGIDAPKPRLSWEVDDPRRGARQTAYRILVASDEGKLEEGRADVWDTNIVRTSQSIHVVYDGPALRTASRYAWTVRTWDQDGRPSRYATPAVWETGLLGASAWQARWISVHDAETPGRDEANSIPCRSHWMRKTFRLEGEVVRARAYASGLGIYELWINGQRVWKDIFTPGWTAYDKRVQYQTYDVTSMLSPGLNAVGAILGNGWWSGGLSLGRGKIDRTSKGNLRFLLEMRIEYAGGGSQRVVTDGTWRARPSAVLEDSFYHGETYDARLELTDWASPAFDDRAWSPAVVQNDGPDNLVAQQTETIQVTQELGARTITQPKEGVYVVDFGQNHAGRPQLRVEGPRGTRVQIRYAETLQKDGMLDRRNLVGARATDTYILKGSGAEIWEPRFTYRGYRYAELTGYPGVPSEHALTSRVLHSAAAPAGTFECSNELINRIHQNIVWAQRSNMYSVPTDCPQRDERLGWTGDAHVFAPTACWNMDMATFFSKYLADMRDSQDESGYVYDVAPAAVVKGPAAPGWGDAITGIPWTLYRFYRDTRVIEDNYQAMRAWVEYMRAHATNYLYECPHQLVEDGYGDWVAVVKSPPKPIAAAFFYYSTDLLARMASLIGRSEDAAAYAELAKRIAAAFHRAFFDPDTESYLGGTQTAQILPLAMGITPPDQRRAVLDKLVRDIEERDVHLSTGFLGTAFVLPLLSSHGHHELAYRLATQRSYPSWGYMVECGATTMCELWNPDTGDPRMNSWNHFALGSVGRWFYEELAGIHVDMTRGPANDLDPLPDVVIRPRPAGDLTWARAEYKSIYGLISCHWERGPGSLRLNILIPANTAARICVPTLGWPKVTVTDGGRALLVAGRQAASSDELAFVDLDEEGFAVFDAVPGRYSVTVAP